MLSLTTTLQNNSNTIINKILEIRYNIQSSKSNRLSILKMVKIK